MDNYKKKKKIIGCDEVNSLPIDDVIESFGYKPIRRKKHYCLYQSPLRQDKNPSFITYRNSNRYKDMATGTHGSVIDFVMAHENCSVGQAIQTIKSKQFINPIINMNSNQTKNANRNKITSIRTVNKYALIQYAEQRKIHKEILCQFTKEINYQVDGKNFFSIGMQNVLGGWELRNRYNKSSLHGKSFSFFKGQNQTLWLLEGMFDFLTLMQNKNDFCVSDRDNFLVLNSLVHLVKCKKYLKSFSTINLCLDNDESGQKVTKKITNEFHNAIDHSPKYMSFTDLNEWYCATVQ